jgi:hypothetical protein
MLNKIVEQKCGYAIEIGDDHGDNSCTMKCELELAHDGNHAKEFSLSDRSVHVYWEQKSTDLAELEPKVEPDLSNGWAILERDGSEIERKRAIVADDGSFRLADESDYMILDCDVNVRVETDDV